MNLIYLKFFIRCNHYLALFGNKKYTFVFLPFLISNTATFFIVLIKYEIILLNNWNLSFLSRFWNPTSGNVTHNRRKIAYKPRTLKCFQESARVSGNIFNFINF